MAKLDVNWGVRVKQRIRSPNIYVNLPTPVNWALLKKSSTHHEFGKI